MTARGDDAVSDVVGNILLVGITVGLMSAMSVAVLFIGGPEDVLHADLAVDLVRGGDLWGDGDEAVRLRHVGGEGVRGVEVTVSVDGVGSTHEPADGGFLDGVLRMGESWSLTTTLAEGALVVVAVVDPASEALLVSTGAIVAGGASGSATTYTYVASGAAATGTLADLANAQVPSDGASATLTESSTPGAPASATFSATTVASSTGATDPSNVLQSDDARATLAALGDSVEVEGFSVPSGATVTDVSIGFEAQRSGGGSLSPQLTLSYSVSGAAGTTGLSATVATATDDSYTVDVTGDRNWTAQDVADLRLSLVRDSIDTGVRDAAVDHLFATVTYTLPVTQLEATLDFSGVPAGTHTLQVRYATSVDSFDLQVWDGVAFVSRATLDSASPATLTYALLPAEYNGGAPMLRVVDLDSGTGTGVLTIDYARVATS